MVTQLVEAVRRALCLSDKTPDLAAANWCGGGARVRQLRGLEITRARGDQADEVRVRAGGAHAAGGLPAELREDSEVAAAPQAWVCRHSPPARSPGRALRDEANVTVPAARWLCRHLWRAAMDGSRELSRLLERGVSVDWRDDRGWTPLFATVGRASSAACKASVRARGRPADTPRRDAADTSGPRRNAPPSASPRLRPRRSSSPTRGRSGVDNTEQDHAPVLALLRSTQRTRTRGSASATAAHLRGRVPSRPRARAGPRRRSTGERRRALSSGTRRSPATRPRWRG